MEIPQVLQQKLSPAKRPGWWQYHVKTPARHFVRYITHKHGVVFLFTTINGCHNSDQWPLFCSTIESVEANVLQEKFLKLPTGNLPGNFDTLILLPPSFHKCHREFSDELHLRTFVAIPAFDCEFSQDESPPTVAALRDFDPMNDWGRDPSPKIKMQYLIDETGERSRNFGLTSLRSAILSLANLQESKTGFVRLENYRNEIFHALKTPSGFSGQNRLTQDLLLHHSFIDAAKKFVHGQIPIG